MRFEPQVSNRYLEDQEKQVFIKYTNDSLYLPLRNILYEDTAQKFDLFLLSWKAL